MGYTRIDDSGLIIYGASGLGACTQALYYDRMGVTGEPPPDWLQVKFDEGNANEALIIQMLEDQGVWSNIPFDDLLNVYGYIPGEYDADREVDYFGQVRVEAPVIPGVVVRAHLDGIGQMTKVPEGWTRTEDQAGDQRVLEVKAFGEDYWGKFKKSGLAAFPGYALQVTAQMRGAGLKALFVVGRKDKDGKVIEIDMEYVDTPPSKWLDVIMKVKKIEGWINDPSTAPDTDACELPLMYPCPYFKLHNPDMVSATRVKVVAEETERSLVISLGEEYERHKIAEKHHKDMKSRAAKQIAEWFDSKDAKGGETSVGAWSIKDTVVPHDGALHSDKIKAKYPDIDLTGCYGDGYEVRYPIVTKKNTEDKKKGS